MWAVTTEPLRAFRDHLSELVDRVEQHHERVIITRNSREVAVLVSTEDLAQPEETLSVLSDPEALADIREARCRLRPWRRHERDRSGPPASSVSEEGRFELVFTPPARRALTVRLPETVAAAVLEFLTTALVQQPRRVGRPLRGELAGLWSARRGTYRVLYRVRDEPAEVVVVRIEHRRDVYRPG